MKTILHKFVEYVPAEPEEGIVYISVEYKTAVHKCVCGCGNKVVTPLTPTDWKLVFDGKTVSLSPSIGNWSFECRSHYWIRKSHIEFAESWTEKEVRSCRESEFKRKKHFYNEFDKVQDKQPLYEKQKLSFWEKLSKLLRLQKVD